MATAQRVAEKPARYVAAGPVDMAAIVAMIMVTDQVLTRLIPLQAPVAVAGRVAEQGHDGQKLVRQFFIHLPKCEHLHLFAKLSRNKHHSPTFEIYFFAMHGTIAGVQLCNCTTC